MKITKTTRTVLAAADLENNQINNVAMSTMYGLETREIITSDWRRPRNVCQVTGGGDFPRFYGVQLTHIGVNIARSIQGMTIALLTGGMNA